MTNFYSLFSDDFTPALCTLSVELRFIGNYGVCEPRQSEVG